MEFRTQYNSALSTVLQQCSMKKVTILFVCRDESKMSKLNDPIIFLIIMLNLWNHTLCLEGVLFKRILATTDFLAQISTFNAKSRIECGSQCFLKTDHNPCTAFSLEGGICTCGKKRFAPVHVTGSGAQLYVVDSCPKVKTGQLCLSSKLCTHHLHWLLEHKIYFFSKYTDWLVFTGCLEVKCY